MFFFYHNCYGFLSQRKLTVLQESTKVDSRYSVSCNNDWVAADCINVLCHIISKLFAKIIQSGMLEYETQQCTETYIYKKMRAIINIKGIFGMH